MESATLELDKEVLAGLEKIVPPEGTYFIHGIRDFTLTRQSPILHPEISCSLQLDGNTKPFRPYGYVIEVDKGSLNKAFPRDVSSLSLSDGKRLGRFSRAMQSYDEDQLEELIKNTPRGKHNELWVLGDGYTIVGAYQTAEALGKPGIKQFLQSCKRRHLPIRVIPPVEVKK